MSTPERSAFLLDKLERIKMTVGELRERLKGFYSNSDAISALNYLGLEMKKRLPNGKSKKMRHPSPLQIKLLDILNSNQENPLTYREIQQKLSLKSVSTVDHHLKMLVKKGCIEKTETGYREPGFTIEGKSVHEFFESIT